MILIVLKMQQKLPLIVITDESNTCKVKKIIQKKCYGLGSLFLI